MTDRHDDSPAIGIPPGRATWGASVVILAFLCLVLGQVVGTTMFDALGVDDDWGIVGASLGFFAVFGLVAALLRRDGPPAAEALGLQATWSSGLRHAVLYFLPHLVIYFGAALIAGFILAALGAEEPRQAALDHYLGSRSNLPLQAAILVVAVILAPIAEELLFRGLFFGFLRKHCSFWRAAVLQGFLFGLLHVEGWSGLVFILPLGAMGVFLAWLRVRSGSIHAAMLVHSMHNALILVLAPMIREASKVGP